MMKCDPVTGACLLPGLDKPIDSDRSQPLATRSNAQPKAARSSFWMEYEGLGYDEGPSLR